LTRLARIGNSGGNGVAFHRVPDNDASSREMVYPDDTILRVLEAPISGDGHVFARIVAPDGIEGFLPLRYLLPDPGSACFEPTPVETPVLPPARPARVVRVIDAGTLELDIDGQRDRVGLVGVAVPSALDRRRAGWCYAREASAAARRLLPAGAAVSAFIDPSARGGPTPFRRWAFVWLGDGRLLNDVLLRNGLTDVADSPGVNAFDSSFRAARDEARAARRGIWAPGACAIATPRPQA
jgi:micrococcal nuclease